MFYREPDFLKSFLCLIKECDAIVLKIYNTSQEFTLKDDNSPITQADIQCNTHICNLTSNDYQLDFFTPGRLPFPAKFLKQIRQIPNFLI